jgi:hypothetical protein
MFFKGRPPYFARHPRRAEGPRRVTYDRDKERGDSPAGFSWDMLLVPLRE